MTIAAFVRVIIQCPLMLVDTVIWRLRAGLNRFIEILYSLLMIGLREKKAERGRSGHSGGEQRSGYIL